MGFLRYTKVSGGSGGSSGAVSGRSLQCGFDVARMYLYINFWKSWGMDGSASINGVLPSIFDANGYPNGTPSNNLGATIFLPTNYSGQWVLKWTGTLGWLTLATGMTEVGSSGFLSGSNFNGTNGRVVFTFNTVTDGQVNTYFNSGFTNTSLNNIVLCRIGDETAIANGAVFNPDFLSFMTTENPQILRMMGLMLNSGNEQLTCPNYAYQTPLTAMTYRETTYPPGAYAGNISGAGALTCGAYPDMPGSWTDKEVFLANIPANTVTVTIASPARLTLPKSVIPGEMIVLHTTGALPTGLVASPIYQAQNIYNVQYTMTVYYALDSGSSNIRVATTPGGTAISTSGTQSGVHSMNPHTTLVVTAIADNGSNIPRLTLQSTSGLATNDIVQVSLDNIGAFKIAVIDGTHIDLVSSYPSNAVIPFAIAGISWHVNTGWGPGLISKTTINVAGRGPKQIVGTGSLPALPGFLGMGIGLNSGCNVFVYDALLDCVIAAPGALYVGMPLSLQIGLANALNKHLWYSPSVYTTDAAFTSMATAAANGLNANLRLYLAYGNETWNRYFTQYFYMVRRGVALNFAYNGSGDPQQALSASGLRTIQMMQLAKTAWTATGRSAASLKRVISVQAAGGTSTDFPAYLLNGNDLPAPNNVAPNRPVDFADVLTFANYWQGVLLNGQYAGASASASDYAALLTAGDNYASGVSASMTAALTWVTGDILGTNGTAVPPGTANFSIYSQSHTGGSNMGWWNGWETTVASYDTPRAGFTPALPPLDVVAYEGGLSMLLPRLSDMENNMGITLSSGTVSWGVGSPAFTWVGNTLKNGTRISIPSGVSLPNMSQFNDYFVMNLSGNAFNISASNLVYAAVIPLNTGSGTAKADPHNLDNLIYGYLNNSVASAMVQTACAAFVNASFPHNKVPAFLQLEGPSEWSMLPGDLYSTPYQLLNGVIAYNA